MHDFITLSKLLFKSNYKLDLHSKKGKQSLIVGFVVFLCLLPSLGMFYMLFHSAFSTLNLDLLILQLGFCGLHCSCFHLYFIFPMTLLIF